MKTVFVAVNARYSHSSLAIRYIEKYNIKFNPELMEFSINDSIGSIYSALVESGADVYCFSCYIWNIEIILKAAELIKKAMPNIVIIFGGPESGYNSDELLKKYNFIDTIIRGEGEIIIGKVLELIQQGKRPNRFYQGECVDLNSLKFPYTTLDIENLKNKILYFETSRGCPFRCAYCLSSADSNGIRYFPMEYVKKGFKFFFDKKVPLVKLIDRTFNCDSKRAVEIVNYIIENSTVTKVHFEIEASILTDELISVLNSAPKDMFQIEVGVQTINHEALTAVNRNYDLEKIRYNIRRLTEPKNIHIHLDLIAGLPFEDYNSFIKSFNFVYSMSPDMLQLGFLKVLKGTQVSERFTSDIKYAEFPPYEVISTKWISASELLKLKKVENAVDMFYNSGKFFNSIRSISEKPPYDNNPYSLFEQLGEKVKSSEKAGKLANTAFYEILYEVFGDCIIEELAVDFIKNNKTARLPKFLHREMSKSFKTHCIELINNPNFVESYKISRNLKDLRFEHILNKVFVMDYSNNLFFDITEWF